MKNNEFKNYVAEFKASLEKVTSIKKVNELANLYNQDTDKFTDKQIDTLYDMFDSKLAELVAKAESKKGGKHMSNKKNNKPAEAPTVKEVEKALEAKAEQTIEAPAPVEVLKGEVIDTKNEAEINAAIDRISATVDKIGRGYLEIVGDVARLRKYEAWKLTGHKNLYVLCNEKFGMSKTTVHNLEVVFKKYGDPETFQLTDACAGMSLREMLANVDAEKKAIAGEVAGDAADGEASGEATDSKKTKAQTIINVSYELAGDDWDADAILEEIRKQLEMNPDAKEAFPDGATVTFTISI